MQRCSRLCSRLRPLISRELRKMEEGDGCGDSLFSLELLVETARVEPRLLPSPLPASGPFRPAVALRLLDFPTLLVRAPHCVPGPLVPFGRGKSCLFRLRPDSLRGLLRRSPLHALLLALPPTAGPARLLGSCSVSLAPAAEELLLGTGPGGRRGRFPLRDLMGEPVGELGLSYRLSNLGSTLLGHLGESTASGEPHREEQQQQLRPPGSPTLLGTQSERGLSLELIPEVEEDQDPERGSLHSFCSSHTEPQPNDIARELETEANVFCPPPMYYNCPPEDCCPAPKASEPVTIAKSQESVQKEENTLPSTVPVKKEPSEGGQDMSLSAQTLINPMQLRQTLSQLPLLNALLVELSLLNNQTPQSGTSSVHPKLAWLYQNVEESPKPPPSHVKSVSPPREDKKTHRKERGRSPTLMLRRSHPENLRFISPSFQRTWTGFKASVYERKGSPEKNSKENSPPRRKLTYGMTNTLRLRLQQTNPGMLKVHEKREHRRKKQANVFIRGNTLANSKMLRYSPEHHPKPSGSARSEERGISDQNVQFNENIETLIQRSVEQDSSTTRKELTSDVQNNVTGCHVKSRENLKERCQFKRMGSGYKKRRLKVHLPRVSLQDTDGLENIIDTEAEKCAQDKDCEIPGLQNASRNNLESHHECENSDYISANCENGGYSEDFTNADSSSFEAPLSSSEPLLVNPKPSNSDTDSYSKISERSQASESISSLLPVPSAVSPVQPLKKTSSLKSNDENVDQDKYNDSSPTRSLKGKFLDQQVKKQENKDLQTFENKPESSDLNSRGTKGQSVEKSLSLRTSQVSSYMPSNMSDLSELESNASYKEEQVDFEMPDIANQYKHVSELVVNQLPGYTM